MFEFKINKKQTAMTFDGLRNSSKVKNVNAGSRGGGGANAGGVANARVDKTKYSVQFNNMFTNLSNAKAGCRSCRGTF
jgi:hypothetical protein